MSDELIEVSIQLCDRDPGTGNAINCAARQTQRDDASQRSGSMVSWRAWHDLAADLLDAQAIRCGQSPYRPIAMDLSVTIYRHVLAA